jgi:hypothetical protein
MEKPIEKVFLNQRQIKRLLEDIEATNKSRISLLFAALCNQSPHAYGEKGSTVSQAKTPYHLTISFASMFLTLDLSSATTSVPV